MPKDEDTKSKPSIWKWKNTVHITKVAMQAAFAIALVTLAAKAIYAAAKGAALPLAFLAQPLVIAAIVSYVAVYFIATAISSCQQMTINAIGEKGAPGAPGAPGKDAEFADLISDVIKSGTIVEEAAKTGNQQDVKQLHLKLSKDDYEALTNGKNVGDEVTLNVLLEGKSVEVKFKHVAANDNGNYKVQLISVNGKDQAAGMKEELGMTTDSNLLKVAVSDEDFKALKNRASSKLEEVMVNKAISRVTSQKF